MSVFMWSERDDGEHYGELLEEGQESCSREESEAGVDRSKKRHAMRTSVSVVVIWALPGAKDGEEVGKGS